MRDHRHGEPTRAIRTWRQGEVGLGATRRVLAGGLVVVGGSRGAKSWRRELRSDALLPLVGEVVYVEDIDDSRGWHVATCEWLPNGRVAAGRLVAVIAPTVVPPRGEAAVPRPPRVDGRPADPPVTSSERADRAPRTGARPSSTAGMTPVYSHLVLQGWHGVSSQLVVTVGETPRRFRILALTRTRLAGRDRWLLPGETALVPKTAVRHGEHSGPYTPGGPVQ